MHTKQWLEHFERNAAETLRPEPETYSLSDEERRRIERSIQGFQIGEASEGKCLRGAAERFAEQTGNNEYVKAIGYLIREENRHSAYLGNFMRKHELPFATAKWSDRLFRMIRRLAGIELSVRVLVTAELVALTYYDCLSAATGSRQLATICRRMLEEERKHVAFQMHHIHWINVQKFPTLGSFANLAHAMLMAVTLLIVWGEHGSVLRTKHSFGSFFRRVWSDFVDAMDDGTDSALQELLGDRYAALVLANEENQKTQTEVVNE